MQAVMIFQGGPADGLTLKTDFTADEAFRDPHIQPRSQLAWAYYETVKGGNRCLLHPFFVPGWLTEKQRRAFIEQGPVRMHIYQFKDRRIDGDAEFITLEHGGEYHPPDKDSK